MTHQPGVGLAQSGVSLRQAVPRGPHSAKVMPDISRILSAGTSDALIGVAEDAFLEAKSIGYDLDASAGRFELAKDVSAMANSGGGWILIGVATSRMPDTAIDVISSIVPIAEDSFRTQRCLGVLKDHVYPEIRDV